MTAKESVVEGSRLFADAEDAITKLIAAMPGIINAVRDDGAIGGIEAMKLTAETGVRLNDVLAIVADLHSDLTDRCMELGIDIPTMRSGGGR